MVDSVLFFLSLFFAEKLSPKRLFLGKLFYKKSIIQKNGSSGYAIVTQATERSNFPGKLYIYIVVRYEKQMIVFSGKKLELFSNLLNENAISFILIKN